MKLIFSVFNTYPTGALTSSTVYVPFGKSVNTYGFVVVVNLATSVPSAFLTTNTAPDNGCFVS